MMMVSGKTSNSAYDDDEGLLNVIRLEKISDSEDISNLDLQHVVLGGQFRGVVVRQPIIGDVHLFV